MIDSKLEESLSYASVALYNSADSSLVTGTITDESGNFNLTGVSEGNYFVEIEFIGFQKKTIADIAYSYQYQQIDLGVIHLNPSALELGEVTITNDEPFLQYKIDRKVVNVSQHINATGGTAIDVLENAPSMDTDIEGNITLRGSSNFKVLIDGKPTILEGSDALSQLPASAIEDIEIITNPSAKYDPDGTAGIINVKMKKSKSSGMTGLISGSVGSSPLYSGNILLNYKLDKINFTGGAKYNYNDGSISRSLFRENYFSDSTTIINTKDSGNRLRSGVSLLGGIEYNISEKNTLSLMGTFNNFYSERNNSSHSSLEKIPENIIDYYVTDNSLSGSNKGFQLEFNDTHQFDSPDHLLEISGTIYKGNGTTDELQFPFISDSDWVPLDLETENIQKLITSDESLYNLYFDYTRPIGTNGLLEGGYQFKYDRSETGYLFQTYELNSSVNNLISEDNYDFLRSIHAIYGTYTDRFGKYDIKLGIRAEYTDRVFTSESLLEDFTYNKLDFYPSLYVTRSFQNDQQIQLNYSRRINRPSDRYLNPIPRYSNGFYSFIGNPSLEPEYANSFELNYQKGFGASYIAAETFLRQTVNKITQIQSMTEDNILVYTMDNLNSDFTMGIELTGFFKATEWWQINPTFSLSKYQLNGEYDAEDIIKSSINWNASLDNTFKLKTGTTFQIQGVYKSPTVTLTGNMNASYGLNLAIKQDLFNKASLTFSIRDVFGTMNRSYTLDNPDYYVVGDMSREAPIFTLSFSYRFNNFKNNDLSKSQRTDNMSDYNIY